jgi:hypothetical protein
VSESERGSPVEGVWRAHNGEVCRYSAAHWVTGFFGVSSRAGALLCRGGGAGNYFGRRGMRRLIHEMDESRTGQTGDGGAPTESAREKVRFYLVLGLILGGMFLFVAIGWLLGVAFLLAVPVLILDTLNKLGDMLGPRWSNALVGGLLAASGIALAVRLWLRGMPPAATRIGRLIWVGLVIGLLVLGAWFSVIAAQADYRSRTFFSVSTADRSPAWIRRTSAAMR